MGEKGCYRIMINCEYLAESMLHDLEHINVHGAFYLKTFNPGGRGGGDSHMKQTGMLVVSLRGVNFGFWSRFVPGKAPIIYATEVSFRVPRRNTELREEKQKSNFLLNFLFRLQHAMIVFISLELIACRIFVFLNGLF